jgi:hypothetical protein
MLRGGYIELMGTVGGGESATLSRFLARYAGIHIVALAVADPAAAVGRLRRAGIEAADASEAERLFDDAAPDGPKVRVAVVAPPDLPEGRLLLVRQLTPDVLWQDSWLQHPNRAVALSEVILAVAAPAESAARLSQLAGRPVVPDPLGGYALDLPHGRVRMVPPDAVLLATRNTRMPPPPCIAGVTVTTDDGNIALRRHLGAAEIPFRNQGGTVITTAGGVCLRFEPMAAAG